MSGKKFSKVVGFLMLSHADQLMSERCIFDLVITERYTYDEDIYLLGDILYSYHPAWSLISIDKVYVIILLV